jgi:predicted amidophosphoribosyltransferase
MDATYYTGSDDRAFTARCADCGDTADTTRIGTPLCAAHAADWDDEQDRCEQCGRPDGEHYGFCSRYTDTDPAEGWPEYDPASVPSAV